MRAKSVWLVQSEAILRRTMPRALRLGAALAILVGIVFGPQGMTARDLCDLMAAEPWARAILWIGWLLPAAGGGLALIVAAIQRWAEQAGPKAMNRFLPSLLVVTVAAPIGPALLGERALIVLAVAAAASLGASWHVASRVGASS
jgi:hypothetical protein